MEDGFDVKFGSNRMKVREKKGNKNGCVKYVSNEKGLELNGDEMIIRGWGRNELKEGS